MIKPPDLTIRTTLLMIIGALNLLIAALVGGGVYHSWANYRAAQSVKSGSAIIDALYEASRHLSLERAASLSVIYVGPETAAFLQEDLLQDRREADHALKIALASGDPKKIALITGKYETLKGLRRELDQALQKPHNERDIKIADQFFKASTSLIGDIQGSILTYSRSYQAVDAAIGRQMMFKYFVWELAEYAGEEYAIIGRMIAESKRPMPDQQEQLISLRGRIQYGWEILRKFSMNEALAEKLLPYMEEAETHYFLTFEQIRGLFYGLQPVANHASYPISIELWLGMAADAVDSLLALQAEVLKETQQHVRLMEKRAQADILTSMAIFTLALGLSLFCWRVVVFRVAEPINAMVTALYKATRDEVYEMPHIGNRQDEIGKLARVLEVFQENAKKMKQSNEELERFAYIAAHDLKSPLRAVENISQWLEEDLAELLPEKDRKYMEELRRRVHHMDKLLDDTLEYARIGAKMERKVTEMVNGRALINEIAALLEFPKGFTLDISPNFYQIQFQKLPLQQVLYNLINNALKHHNKETGTIAVDVEDKGEEYIFRVRDDGPGIDPQYHQKIFEMFQTLQPRDKSKGRGMGLAMVRKIVMTNGGTITVNSQAGAGAEFCFTWKKLKDPTRTERENHDVDDRRQYA